MVSANRGVGARRAYELSRKSEQNLVASVGTDRILVEVLRKSLDEDDVGRVDADSSSKSSVE